MPTEFRRLQHAARALKLTYQQLLARYHADQGPDAPRSGALAWAQQEVKRMARHELHTSVAAAQQRRSWDTLALRLEPGVHARLMARVDADRMSAPHTVFGLNVDRARTPGAVLSHHLSFTSGTAPRVDPGHYLDAALRTAPRHRAGQLGCLRDFLTTHGVPLTPGRQGLYRLGPRAREVVTALKSPHAPDPLPRHQTNAVITALTARYLDHLDNQHPR
ncbi:hypothetical protein [Streptomyces sp. MMBL 11-1]|uniref:hypothetical protein n=1 Tax=Streptomyces sp. MMBL 11-1 TaxID=3026420 RepID=UPI002362CE61|nr:hypothetical protein [Streptomyces sp. MMBL 11-1]